jgi:hypothetical protein
MARLPTNRPATTDDVLFSAEQYASVSVGIADAVWSANADDSEPLSVNNRDLPEGQSVVLDYQFDASGASGTANFVNLETLELVEAGGSFTGESIPGTFDVTC